MSDTESLFDATRDYEYVAGCLPSGEHVTVVLERTEQGWSSRSTQRSMFNHEYVRYETIEDVCSWLRCQLRGTTVLRDRQEALERLTILSETTDASPLPKTGFLTGSPTWTPSEHAEAVCRHLELGW